MNKNLKAALTILAIMAAIAIGMLATGGGPDRSDAVPQPIDNCWQGGAC